MWCFTLSAAWILVGLVDSQRFLSREGSHEVLKGQDVQLGCVVADSDDYTVMWFKGDPQSNDLIYAGDQLMGSDSRFELRHPDNSVWNLTIREVAAYDSGTYSCQISEHGGNLFQRQVLIVKTPPSLDITPETNPLTLEPGDPMDLTCFPEGNPRPTVTWRKSKGALPSGEESLENMRLHVRNVQPEDAGEYQCTAENGVGDPATGSIHVVVHSSVAVNESTNAPWVKAARKVVPASLGDNVNITCMYDAKPDPTVSWYLNGWKVTFTANGKEENRKLYVVRKTENGGHTEGILAVSRLTQEDFGTYTCRVANNLGTEEAKIEVSGTPMEAKVESDSRNGTGTEILLRWTLESPTAIQEYRIRYKAVHEDSWVEITVPASQSDKNGNMWRSSYGLKDVEPRTDYEIQVQGKNELGWGSLPSNSNFRFRTGSGDSAATPSTSSSSSKEPPKGIEREGEGSPPTSGAQGLVFPGSLWLRILGLALLWRMLAS